ncbi:MAG: rhomboid family intramembrane serine protease [Pseudomonadota bacterium]|nr:rhomboid family intramembrane serine protease [Pseudomonadota bacterium]
MTDSAQTTRPIAPLRHWWLTASLIGLNLLVFVIGIVLGLDALSPKTIDLLNLGANFAPLTATGDTWRLLSSMFLHIGLVHLLINMWALFLFGSYAEFYFGRNFYAMLYLLSGLMGSIATTWWNMPAAEAMLSQDIPQQLPAISAGASGAIMGLGGALLIAAWRPRADLAPHARLNLRMLLTLMLINVAIGLLIPNIDNAAHLGGAITGAMLAWLFTFSYQAWRPKQPLSLAIRWIGVLIVAATVYYLIQQLQTRGIVLQELGQQIRQELSHSHRN